MNVRILIVLILAVAGGATAAAAELRIGTFDTRGVALAYGRSPEFQERVDRLRADRAAAEADGDADRIRDLETRGAWLQEHMHMQVFGNLPVDDILAGRAEMLAEVAADAGVMVLVPSIAYAGPGVETVDVTEAIARRLGVDEGTLKMVREIGDHPPVELPHDFSGE